MARKLARIWKGGFLDNDLFIAHCYSDSASTQMVILSKRAKFGTHLIRNKPRAIQYEEKTGYSVDHIRGALYLVFMEHSYVFYRI